MKPSRPLNRWSSSCLIFVRQRVRNPSGLITFHEIQRTKRKNHLCVGDLCHIERAGRNYEGYWSSPGERSSQTHPWSASSASMVVSAGRSISQGFLRIVSGLAGNTNSIFCESSTGLRPQWMSVFCKMQEPAVRGIDAQLMTLINPIRALQRAHDCCSPRSVNISAKAHTLRPNAST